MNDEYGFLAIIFEHIAAAFYAIGFMLAGCAVILWGIG